MLILKFVFFKVKFYNSFLLISFVRSSLLFFKLTKVNDVHRGHYATVVTGLAMADIGV